MKVLLLSTLLLASVSVPPGVQEWAQAQGLRPGLAQSRVDRDWTVFKGQFLPPSGKITVKLVSPTEGGGGVVYNLMRYDLVYPRDTPAAIRLIGTYEQQDVLKSLSAQKLNACIEAVQLMKAPQVKTILWTMLSKSEGRLRRECLDRLRDGRGKGHRRHLLEVGHHNSRPEGGSDHGKPAPQSLLDYEPLRNPFKPGTQTASEGRGEGAVA